MTEHQGTISQEVVERLAGKLKAFYDQLPADEQEAMARLVIQEDVRGFDFSEKSVGQTVNLNLQDIYTFVLNGVMESTVSLETTAEAQFGDKITDPGKSATAERGLE